jgi:DNA-binding PadR family transcriptional regulator
MTEELTTTSYALLGLLSIKAWTTYELAEQMKRSLRYFWPRAESRLYEEPKRLAALGLATATRGATGKRTRTIYRITPAGRRALRAWLRRRGMGPVLEFEMLLKVFFAENGTKQDAVRSIAAIKAWAEGRVAENIEASREHVAGTSPFPHRLPQIVLVGKFLTDFADMVAAWTEWAEEVVASWPEDLREAEPNRAVLHAIASRALPLRP